MATILWDARIVGIELGTVLPLIVVCHLLNITNGLATNA